MSEKYSKSIDKLVETFVSKHKIQQTVDQINSYGFDFEDMFIEKDYSVVDEKIEVEVSIKFLKDHFLKPIYSKYGIDEIEYTYSNFQIEIDEVSSEDSSMMLSNKLQKIQQMKEEWDELVSDSEVNLSNNFIDREDEVEQAQQLEERRLKKIADEIELTINEQLSFLQKETKELEEDLTEKIYEYLESKQVKKGFFNSLANIYKNYQVNKTKDRVVDEYMLNVDMKILDYQEEKVKLNEKIENHNKRIKASAEKYNTAPIWKIPQVFLEIRVLKEKGKVLKREVNLNKEKIDMQISYLKKSYVRIEEEIKVLIDEKYEEILLDKYMEYGSEDEMYVSERQLEHYTLKDYLQIAKKYNLD
jgi:hypothetical protein